MAAAGLPGAQSAPKPLVPTNNRIFWHHCHLAKRFIVLFMVLLLCSVMTSLLAVMAEEKAPLQDAGFASGFQRGPVESR